ncbi:methylmalonyl-CoA mutase family protein [Limimaricola sp.]|uniref:methylmalonyl-CoA mutase family protein n=1 Tax=Limimaricola sp. TaxID=2211665 RepID=UPI0040589C9E
MTDPRPTPIRPDEAMAVTLRPDLPTRAGIDADHPLARGLVGGDGPAISHLGDLAALLPETARVVEIDSDATGPWLLAMLAALAKRRGVPTTQLRGGLCNDPIASARGAAAPSWSAGAAVELAADTLSWSRRVFPDLFGARIRIPATDDLTEAMAAALRSALALLAATARRDKAPHLRAAAEGVEFVMPGDTARHRAAGSALAALWRELLEERHGPDFARRDDLVLYLPAPLQGNGCEARDGTAPSTKTLRAALERAETAKAPAPAASSESADATGEADATSRVEELARWRRDRDGNAVQKSLLALREAAKRGINVMGPSVACAKAGVTTGEWAAAMAAALPAAQPHLAAAGPEPDTAPQGAEVLAVRERLARAARGLARPITLLVAQPGLDARPSPALPLMHAARACGIDLRDPGPRGLPSRIVEAVLNERPHALCFCLVSRQSAEMALDVMDELHEAGFGSIPALGLVDFEIAPAFNQELQARMMLRNTRDILVSDFLNDLATLVTLRKKVSE